MQREDLLQLLTVENTIGTVLTKVGQIRKINRRPSKDTDRHIKTNIDMYVHTDRQRVEPYKKTLQRRTNRMRYEKRD